MKRFTGWQWLLIDAANQFGHDMDKKTFEERIQWAEANLSVLDDQSMIEQADTKTKPLYIKAVMAIRKAQQGIPTGHMVGVDACCSGIQHMSVLTGCIAGATATGMVDPNRRADAYAEATTHMSILLGGKIHVERPKAKKAVMTSFYGSREQPKIIFGENTPELKAFYEAMEILAPGAWELLKDLLASWQDWNLSHDWKLPDGFDARVKVMAKREARVEIDELNHSSFTYEYYENAGLPKGHPKSKSNVANVTHSMDAYVLREMHRRCNYDKAMLQEAGLAIRDELNVRAANINMAEEPATSKDAKKVLYYVEQWTRSTLASAVILPHVNKDTVGLIPTAHLEALDNIVQFMTMHRPFPIVTVHDEFKSHANNVDWMRMHYREIMAEVADSYVLDDILTQIYKQPCQYNRQSTGLGALIRRSNYALS